MGPGPLSTPSIPASRPSSRTPVTISTNFQNYRFFAQPATGLLHATRFFRRNHLPSASLQKDLPPGSPSTDLFLFASGEHAGHASQCPLHRMLLPLCGIAPPQRLCEGLRLETIRLAVVGKEVRQAPHANSHGEPQRRPAPPSSRSRRACQAVAGASGASRE
jgi:hypothetical protein